MEAIQSPFKVTKRVKQKTASYILASFFHARFLSALEKIKRLLAFFFTLFSRAFRAKYLWAVPFFLYVPVPSDAIKTVEVFCYMEKHNA